jgi:methionyl-tRNA formyltransferase
MERVEMLLGGWMGGWAFDQVRNEEVSRIVTTNSAIIEAAKQRQVPVETTDVNSAPPSRPVVGISVHYPKILSAVTLSRYLAVYNLHPSLLPWGRGAYAAFWSIWANEPAGASLHKMTDRIDAGPLVDQILTPVLSSDTCGTLHARIKGCEQVLFEKYWPRLTSGERLDCHPQSGGGSYHSIADYDRCVAAAETIERVPDLLRILRAVTFDSDSRLSIGVGGRVFDLRLDVGAGDNASSSAINESAD